MISINSIVFLFYTEKSSFPPVPKKKNIKQKPDSIPHNCYKVFNSTE